ncbi:hypothetical protein K8T06_12095 [bacterium]|nr:hypothetical protein [bacterium]
MLSLGYVTLYEGKNFWHYDDHWEARSLYCIALTKIKEKASWITGSRYFRIAYRAVASATNERTVIFSVIPPATVFGNSSPVERDPAEHSKQRSILLISVANTYSFDWTARIRTGSNLNKFILFSCPFPNTKEINVFLVHSAMRLSCNNYRYKSLWIELIGNLWREPGIPTFTWPLHKDQDDHWKLRSAIDSVVAKVFGLSRDQYEHVLSTFSHKSYPKAPELCLAKYDELKAIGLEAFTKKYDPYWDIPLNENLPQPDPIVSAAIEKFMGKAQKSGKSEQKELF